MPVSEEYYFSCPYCASENSLLVDFTAGRHQKFITDCEICCRPILVRLQLDEENVLSFDASTE
ncbi:MAG: CPXCG motif-containing cysteine-rich protein [Candidatus Omnitrophota bacterium]